jgi:hypothetical protein
MRHQSDPNRLRVEMRSQDYGILRGRHTPPPSIAPIVAESCNKIMQFLHATNLDPDAKAALRRSLRNCHFGNAIYQCGSHEATMLAE